MAVHHHSWVLRLLVVGLTGSGLGWILSWWMVRSTRGRLLQRVEEVPAGATAIVLGAPVGLDERVKPMLEDRLQAALDLYRGGKIGRILLSGNGEPSQGSETRAMERWIRAAGVPFADLLVDPRGIRTLTSLRRAVEEFEIPRAVLCTQTFHLPRALWLSAAVGLDAVGLAADRRPYQNLPLAVQREFFGRQVAFLEALPIAWRRRRNRSGS